jgi:hypothetical protein
MMIPVALVFLAFAHRINDAGSTHAYVWGGAGCSIRLPHRTDGAPLLSHLCRRWHGPGGSSPRRPCPTPDFATPTWWGWAGVSASLVAVLARRRILVLTRLIMVLEGTAMLAVLGLAVVIVAQVSGSAAPFSSQPELGLSGMGGELVFAVFFVRRFRGRLASVGGDAPARPSRSPSPVISRC